MAFIQAENSLKEFFNEEGETELNKLTELSEGHV